MILDSSRLADDPQGQEFARAVYDNRNLFAVASGGQTFRPVEGDTGDRAAAVFTRQSAHGIYLAVFNFDEKQSQTITISLGRIDPTLAAASVAVTDVATGKALAPAEGTISVELSAAESKLLELHREE
jgi:hypothetical protein